MMGRGGRGGSRSGCGASSRHHPNTRRGGRNSSLISPTSDAHFDAQQSNGSPRSHFSLREEARNTELHHDWNSDLRLRHARIVFVSAGTSSAEELTQTLQAKSEEVSKDPTNSIRQPSMEVSRDPPNQFTVPKAPPTDTIADLVLEDDSYHDVTIPLGHMKSRGDIEAMPRHGILEGKPPNVDFGEASFFTDLNGFHEPVHTGLPPPMVSRSSSPSSSDFSEEVIVFTGRGRSRARAAIKVKSDVSPGRIEGGQDSKGLINAGEFSPRSLLIAVDQLIRVEQKETSLLTATLEASATMESNSKRFAGHRNGKLETTTSKRGRDERRKRSKRAFQDAEVLADYLANIRHSKDVDDLIGSSEVNQRDLGGSDTAEWQDELEILESDEMVGTFQIAEGWDSAGLQDFDDLSTSSEVLGKVERVLLRRERPSGLQYLVVSKGYTMNDARWLPVSSLGDPGAVEHIRIFEELQTKFGRLVVGSDESDGSLTIDGELALDLQKELGDMEDERDLEERRKSKMTDVQMARLLSKQEELGLGTNDLMISDGSDLEEDGVEGAQLDGPWERAAKYQPQPKSKVKKGSRNDFPSVTAFAHVLDQDPYNGFDIMDQERPSLRKRPKGRRGKWCLELSDSELEHTMQMTWANDRSKKKIRKQERDELRAQGLLGKKNVPDLKAKYAEGMSMTQVKDEIRDFLVSTMDSLRLPPMAQNERKIIHEIASTFKLKSKSIGGGKSRYPVLYRTSQTIQYDEEALGTIEATLASKRFLTRMEKGKRKGGPAGKAGKARGGGFASAGVSYRDGEIVGAAAPELGQENKGRAMLEKMGWSTGKALGALNNNRGIVQPVAQVVKTTKAGLG